MYRASININSFTGTASPDTTREAETILSFQRQAVTASSAMPPAAATTAASAAALVHILLTQRHLSRTLI
jgi:hypothetical protein